MARSNDDDILEPILPKHPPVVGDPRPAEGAVAMQVPEGHASGPSWPRTVLVACAVVATLALVFCAAQLASIAGDQRLQACQVRAYAEETIVNGRDGRPSRQSELRERFADCLGVEVQSDDEDDASRAGDD